jgi:hypothetical protein
MKKPFPILLMSFCLSLSFCVRSPDVDVKKIEEEKDLPEQFCTVWKKGDILVSDGNYLAIFGASSRPLRLSGGNYATDNAMGSILSFVPSGQGLQCEMAIGSPDLRIKDQRHYVYYTSVKSTTKKSRGGNIAVVATGEYIGENKEKLEIETTYEFLAKKGEIAVSSRIRNAGEVTVEDLEYGLYVGANHSYSFSPHNTSEYPGLSFRVYPKDRHFMAWLYRNLNERGEVPRPGDLGSGESYTIQYSLFVDDRGDRLLDTIYQDLQQKTEKATIQFENLTGDTFEIVIRDLVTSSVFYRNFHEQRQSLQVPLPDGLYKVQAHFFPAVTEELLRVEENGDNTCVLEDPAKGTAKIMIRDTKGEFVPGKVRFIGLDPTPTPYFLPENPVKNGRRWETFKNSRFPPEEGLEIAMPVGTYLVTASRGPEYSLDQRIVEVLKDERIELTFTIDKAVDTTGLVPIDPHMHTIYSDARVGVEERIRSVVAEGLEVAMATDHNIVMDYLPALKKLGLEGYLTTVIGNEVTVRGLIHYNTYPLTYRGDEEKNGAILAIADRAAPLFEASRKKDPGLIIQLNHPRAGTIGYFNNVQLETESAASADIHFDTSFDVLESLNGPYFYQSNSVAIQDWLNLMNRGIYKPLIGSSDSHGIDGDEPGYSRTYVYYKGKKGRDLNIAAILEGMKKGHSFATNSPLLDLLVNDNFIPGDSFSVTDGKVNIRVRVQSAPWVSVDEVRIIINGERKLIFPVRQEIQEVLKFDENIVLSLDRDSSIIAEALGKKSLYPVLQAKARDGLLENAVLPYALTNPVFVDVDGNGRFNPPLTEKMELIEITGEKKIIER